MSKLFVLGRIASAALIAASVILSSATAALAAPTSSVECGQLSGYTAPDPLGPAPGSLTLGLVPPWDILADASVSVAAAAALPSIVNSGPTCFALGLDADGKVTSLDFAAEGTIAGDVDYDATSGFYVLDDRLLIPTFITDAFPGLAALFVTSFLAGTPVSVTLDVDTVTGSFNGVDGHAQFCGLATTTGADAWKVGDAVLPPTLLDADDLAALAAAG